MRYGAGNDGKTVVYKHFLDEKNKMNAKHIRPEVQEFLTASHITNVISGMLAVGPTFPHISSTRNTLCRCIVPLCDASAAASACVCVCVCARARARERERERERECLPQRHLPKSVSSGSGCILLMCAMPMVPHRAPAAWGLPVRHSHGTSQRHHGRHVLQRNGPQERVGRGQSRLESC
jgi:hypothetical protein